VTLLTSTIFRGVFCEEEISLLNLMWMNFSVQGDKIILRILAKKQKVNVRIFKVQIVYSVCCIADLITAAVTEYRSGYSLSLLLDTAVVLW